MDIGVKDPCNNLPSELENSETAIHKFRALFVAIISSLKKKKTERYVVENYILVRLLVQSTVAVLNVIALCYTYEHINCHYLLVNWN